VGVGDDPAAPGGCTRASAPCSGWRWVVPRHSRGGRAGWVGGGGGGAHAAAPAACPPPPAAPPRPPAPPAPPRPPPPPRRGPAAGAHAAAPAACCTTLTRMPRPEITGDHRRGGERRFDGSKAQRSPSLAQRSLLGTAHQMEGRRLEGTHATVTVACKPTNVAQCEWPIE
jgi:hypothetical protein